MRSEKELRSLVRRELKGLNLDLPFDAIQMCQRYGERRGRAINVLGHPLPAGTPNGVWLVTAEADYFFYQVNTSRVHRDQIVIHEFGHLIAGHNVDAQTGFGRGGLGSGNAAPGSKPAAKLNEPARSAALSRTCYDDEREWEAEMIASIVGSWVAEATKGVGETSSNVGLRNIQRVLGGHSGWL